MIAWLKRLLGIRPVHVERRNTRGKWRDLGKPVTCQCGNPRCDGTP